MARTGWRHTTRVALILCAVLLLGGCAGPESGSAPAPPAPVGTRVLTLWHALPADQAAVLQGIADEWATQQAAPARIELERSPDVEVLHQKLLAAIQTETMPTLAFVRPPDIAEYVESDALLPLDPLLEAGARPLTDAERGDFYSQFFDSVRYPKSANQLYAWPLHRHQTLLFLNRTRAEALGAEVPPDSWEDLVKMCAAHMAASGESCFAAFPTGSVAVLWVWSHGGEILDPTGVEPAFQGASGREVMRWLGALRAVDGVYLAPTYEANVDAFVSGRTLFDFDSTEAIPEYEARINSAFDMAVLPPPSTGPTPVTVATGGNLAIFRSDEGQEALAWEFLRYLTDTERNYRWAAAIGAYPVRRSALAKMDAQWPEFSRLRQAAEWLPLSRSEPLLATWPEIEKVLAQAMINTINGQEMPDDALAEAARKAQGLLDP